MVKDKVGKDRVGAVREAKAALQVPDVAVAGKDLEEAVATGRVVAVGTKAVGLEVVVPVAAVEAMATDLGSRRSPNRPRSGTYSKRGVVTWKKSWHR
jgi:hypothetical protein